MFVVTVTFTLKPGAEADFLPLMMDNARLSLELEPGCTRFDVCAALDNSGEIFLYEIYEDPAAYEVHKTMAHFLEFTEKTAALVACKAVKTFTLLD